MAGTVALSQSVKSLSVDELRKGFLSPPGSARPGVYWYFMDGNRTRESMTKDMEAMVRAGIGSVVYLEVNVGVPRGSVAFLSPEWNELFAHAVHEGERLGIEVILGTGPGWAGSGGPWVRAEQSMQHLVASKAVVHGGQGSGKQKIILSPAPPMKPFFGRGSIPQNMRAEWEGYYKDVAVLAFPTPDTSQRITDVDEKALYYRAPYTSANNVKQYLSAPSVFPATQAGVIVPTDKIIDLTGRLKNDSVLEWEAPAGDWTVMRFVTRNNGAVTRPAPVPGLGFEVDKMDTSALNAHLDDYVGKLLEKTGRLDGKSEGGFKRLHIDSWEMGAQNWTAGFREQFRKRRGYDPQPYYPVYAGFVVGSIEQSERFLWDLRQTAQELVLENHAGHVKEYSHRRGLQLSIEPYDMNPAADLELGAIADIPMCEFWSKGYGFNSAFSCIEATSIAHVGGKSLVPAEAFTAQNDEGWKQYPGSMKNQGDWAFATGINKFMYHTFQSQSLADGLKPGMTMGPYGVHWDRNQTWWPMADGYHRYIARCQYILQQGRTVADILYLTPEGAPHVFKAPSSAMDGDEVLPDRKGFNFDGCAPGQLYAARVEQGRIVFPGGASYAVLVLPAFHTMTPALLRKIAELVSAGATVIGAPPVKSPGLSGYPQVDQQVVGLAKEMWGGLDQPSAKTIRQYGKGKLIWGGAFSIETVLAQGSLYPDYGSTAEILHASGSREDLVSAGAVRYTHRKGDGWELYFVSNRKGERVQEDLVFRDGGGSTELWDPMTGKSRILTELRTDKDGRTVIPMQFEPYQSWFVFFRKAGHPLAVKDRGKNFPVQRSETRLEGEWALSFDTAWGGPAKVVFKDLTDWTQHQDPAIKYYSGIARYQKTFDYKRKGGQGLYLDLGDVKDLARVKLNGIDLGVIWTAPYRVDISGVVRAKGNYLEIEVANRWPNRLIGDEALPDDGIKDGRWPEWLTKGLPRTSGRRTFATYPFYNKDSPLFSSGLLGPVSIREF